MSVVAIGFAYLLTALEIPLPIFVHKPSSQPYPCQNHPCGCQTAEQCWSQCCCYSPEERWAWARAHNVEPPAYAEKPAPKPIENVAVDGWNTPKLRDRDKPAERPVKTCCSTGQARSSCCASPKPVSSKPPSQKQKSVPWRTAMSAWRCQGYATVWINSGSVLPVPAADWEPIETPPAVVVLPALRSDTLPSTPPDPPPRWSSV